MVIGWRPPRRTPQLESHWFEFPPALLKSHGGRVAFWGTCPRPERTVEGSRACQVFFTFHCQGTRTTSVTQGRCRFSVASMPDFSVSSALGQ
jgi:hypothetical protein